MSLLTEQDQGRVRKELNRMRDWSEKLYKLSNAIEEAFPEQPGIYDEKLATLVRWAWEESYSERKRLANRIGPGEQP